MSRAANDMLEPATHDRPNGSVCERFRSIAKRYPERIAVCDDSTRLSYAELDERTDQVARALIARGLSAQEPIALSIPKSCDQIVALLGVLKAGGAYVPIVANQPESRLRSMLHDAGVRFAITQSGYLDELWGDETLPLSVTQLCAESHQTLLPELVGSSLAYIMYTSGSTGVPKGVLIEHAGIIRLVCGQSYLPFGPELTYLCAAPLSFDVSTLEIFTPLLHGAKCVIAPEGMPDADRIASLTDREQVRSCCLAFGLFRTLFEANPSIFDPMTHIAVGGERVEPRVIAAAQDRLPHAKFVNAYGPTEATMLATTYTLNERVDEAQEHIPIGAALQGVTTHVLDDELRPVPQGDPGELCLGGIGIARGYLNRPDLTDDRFVTIDRDGRAERVYRTGDRVIMDDHHQLIFLGRMDAQIKLRGHRIELGEIEQCAMRLGWVSGAVACVIETDGSSRIGLLIKTGSITPDLDALRTHLQSNLPGAMVPDLIGAHDELPLNRNGKIDRALAAELLLAGKLEHDADRGEGSLPLSTETQRGLAGLMSEVLGVPVRAASDRFLHLGGHSLRAVVLCSRIRDQFSVRIPISSIYEHPSVAQLAEYIDALLKQERTDAADDLIERVGDGQVAPLSFNQLRLWMLDQLHPGDPRYTISLRLEHRTQIQRAVFQQAWEMICDRHEVLMARISSVDTSPVQVIGTPSTPIWRDAQSMTPAEIEAMIAREAARGFDLECGPLARCVVIDRGASATVVISMHHIISDGWSCEVLQRELRDLYIALSSGATPQLAPLPVRYSDYARWERQLTDRASYRDSLAYWTRRLERAPMLRIPADSIKRSSASSAGIRVEHCIDRDELDRLRAAASRLGVTPYVYMLSVFQVWLHRLSLEEDIVVGTPIANRDRTEIEGLVGFFMETLALRSSIRPDDRLADVIARIRSSTLEAFDHRHVPFQHIVEALGLQGSEGHNPLFEVFFNHIAIKLQDAPGTDGVLAFSEAEIDNQTAKFDLTCYVFEQDDRAMVVFNARRSRFSTETVSWYLELFMRLLRSSADHLSTPVSQIPLPLDPISAPGPARVPGPELPIGVRTDGTILDQIKRVIHSNPKGIAVKTMSDNLTYESMWKRSGNLAAAMRSRGIVPGDRVMILADEPIRVCIATLAILRLGAVFVPTDPLWPAARIEQILALAQPGLVLSDRDSIRVDPPVLDLRDSFPEIELEECAIEPGMPAYLMFTSGSTGAPKGVLQTHRGVVGHMQTFAHSLTLTRKDALLQLSSFGFDASIMDMFACWFTGATLCVGQPQRCTPGQLAQWVRDEDLSVVHGAPTLLRWFTGSIDDNTVMPGVRAVVLGGEPASDHDLDAILSTFPRCERFINGLGLTESSLNLQYRVNPGEITSPTSVIPVGYTVEGTRVRLVDPHGNPTGPSGEIEIRSDRIAVEYHTGPDESVVQIGEISENGSGARRFRTGDLGTIRHDGSIMHLGRRDDQVQVRGCRVEPGEVARAIRAINGVRDAAVLAEPCPEGGHTLNAFVVSGDEQLQHELISQLAVSLPPYMIPTQWLRVAQIPRVGGGKIDRQRLKDAGHLAWYHEVSPVSKPITEQVRTIMHAFGHVLGHDQVGPDDHFFRMGGNSLKAIRLFALLRKQLGTDVPISVICRAPTPAALDDELVRARTLEPESGALIELTANLHERRVIVLPGIGGHPLGFAPLIDRIETPACFIGVQYPDEQKLDEIGRELPALARWVISQLRLREGDPIPDMIGYSFGGSLGTEIAMQLSDAGHATGKLILLDSHLPYGLPKKGRIGSARAHIARIVEGHETSRLGYIGKRLLPGGTTRNIVRSADVEPNRDCEDRGDRIDHRRYRAVARMNHQMVVEYRPTLRYHAPVLLLRANQPEWLRFHEDDGFNGFSRVIHADHINRVDIEAGHLELFKPGPADRVAREVDQWLGVPTP